MYIQSFSLFWTIIIYGSIVSLILIFPRTRKLYSSAFDLTAFRKPNTYILMVIALLSIFIANLIIFNHSLLSTFDMLTSEYPITILLSEFELIKYIMYIVIIAPIMEEIIFRVPLSIWMNKLPHFIIVLLTSSILFSFMHPDYPLFGFILGIVFGTTYRLSRSIVPAIFIHIVWNVFSLFYFNYI